MNKGNGVLYLYGNYAGDVMNFDMGAELAEEEDIDVRTVLIWDDVCSAPPTEKKNRRGIAGPGACCEIGGGLHRRLRNRWTNSRADCKEGSPADSLRGCFHGTWIDSGLWEADL